MPGVGNNHQLWQHGQKAKVAAAAGIKQQHLHGILTRDCRVLRRDLADALEAAAKAQGHHIPWSDWMLNTETDNPYFAAKKRQAA